MRASKGGLTHPVIMSLTWRQFETYMDSFTWLLREESDDGRKENKIDDLETMKREPRVKKAKDDELAVIKAKLKPHVDRVRDPNRKRRIVSRRKLV